MKISSNGRKFEGIWIPREIWLNGDLSLQEKVFLVEIKSLDNDEGCWASNKYFSEFFGVTKTRCSQVISALKERGLITVELHKEKKVVVKRIIRIVHSEVFKILNTPIKFNETPPLENFKENNTVINNTSSTNVEEQNSLFPDLSIDKKKKTLYRNCDIKKEGVLENEFKEIFAAGVDVNYYADKVERWSNKVDKKHTRTYYGWRDTIVDFMQGDKENGKVKMIHDVRQPVPDPRFQKLFDQV